MYHILDVLHEYIPDDHSRQATSKYFADRLLKPGNTIRQVMDLGCGAGSSLDYFREKNPAINWVGLDIVRSPDIESRIEVWGEFVLYDGIHMPFDDNQFDLIYCSQVFEHVRRPADLLQEVYRVLRPGGYFVGSTSHLEPFHAHSVWNYTPYGFSLLIEEAGLRLVEFRPGIDALTLIIRRGFRGAMLFSRWWERESPLNLVISLCGKVMRKRPAWINAVKLVFCGQFCFLIRKPGATSPHRNQRRNSHHRV